MKKCLALMFVCAFAGSMASAQWLVYSYKASIHRLDNQISTVKYSADEFDLKANTEAILDSYTTAKDSLNGYLLVPLCIGCSEDGADSSQGFDGSILYVTRKGDKTDGVWKFGAEVDAALFNKGVGLRPEGDEREAFPTSLKKLTQADMGMYYAFEGADLSIDTKYGEVPYGFLGIGSATGEIEQTGFGKAKSLSETTVDFCQGTTTIECMVITSIEGELIGWVVQTGVCTEVPMWDVCALTTTPNGTLHGDWSLKLNEKLSTQVNNSNDVDSLMVDKLGKYLVGESSSAD
jgi:hypothetical protein